MELRITRKEEIPHVIQDPLGSDVTVHCWFSPSIRLYWWEIQKNERRQKPERAKEKFLSYYYVVG